MEKNKSERSIGWLVEEIMKGSVEKNRNRQEQELIRRGEFRDRTERLVRNLMVEELDKAREEWTEELRQAFYDTFYKSGELWFDYIFEDGDTKAEQNAKEVVEEYWKEIISKLTTK